MLQGQRLQAVRTLIFDYHFSDGSKTADSSSNETSAASAIADSAEDRRDYNLQRSTASMSHQSTHDPSSRILGSSSMPTDTGWQEGRWWRRRFVAVYDVVTRSPATENAASRLMDDEDD
jgi:hypothetical protein